VPLPPRPAPGLYGTKELVNQYAAQLVVSCLAFGGADPRVRTFQRFLLEEWDTRCLTTYLDGAAAGAAAAEPPRRLLPGPRRRHPPRAWRPTRLPTSTPHTAHHCARPHARSPPSLPSLPSLPLPLPPAALRKLAEPSRVPAVDFPSDHVPPGGRKGDPPPVDTRKALAIAERVRGGGWEGAGRGGAGGWQTARRRPLSPCPPLRPHACAPQVLGRRSAELSAAFAAALTARSEPTPAAEADALFAAPGAHGPPEVAQVRAFEASRAEFRRLSSAAFLDALCGEYARLEGALRALLPEVRARGGGGAHALLARLCASPLVVARPAPPSTSQRCTASPLNPFPTPRSSRSTTRMPTAG
jgi:hypothetical protein